MRIVSAIQLADHTTFYWCMKRKHQRGLTRISRAISSTADGHLYVAFALALWIKQNPESSSLLEVLLVSILIERLLYFVLKNTCKRNRPPAALPGFKAFIVPADQFSFPSGHTSAAFLFATLLALAFPELTILAFAWSSLVACSRVLLGVHFPSDTLVGASMGVFTALMVASQLNFSGV